MYEDNTACIEWGNHVIGGRERAKHINIRKHFAHEVIQRQEMRLVKVDTSLQLADIFTKPLPYPQFLECLLGILRIRCLTVRAVWKARLVLNPAGTGVTGVMDPGLGSVRPIGRVKGSESTVRIPRGIEAVRLPDRL